MTSQLPSLFGQMCLQTECWDSLPAARIVFDSIPLKKQRNTKTNCKMASSDSEADFSYPDLVEQATTIQPYMFEPARHSVEIRPNRLQEDGGDDEEDVNTDRLGNTEW